VATQLPAEGVGYILKSATSRKNQYGTSTTVASLQGLAMSWVAESAINFYMNSNVTITGIPDLAITIKGPLLFPPLRVGEMSKFGGGPLPPTKGRDIWRAMRLILDCSGTMART
jgi:hypothetical protein